MIGVALEGSLVNRIVEINNTAECNKHKKYRHQMLVLGLQYFIAKVLLLILKIVFTSINITIKVHKKYLKFRALTTLLAVKRPGEMYVYLLCDISSHLFSIQIPTILRKNYLCLNSCIMFQLFGFLMNSDPNDDDRVMAQTTMYK